MAGGGVFGFGGPFGPVFGFHGIPGLQDKFCEQYRCHSVAFSYRNFGKDVAHGGKIIMPQSALEKLARLNISYPMLFKMTNKQNGQHTHCGVLEFVADEGLIYVPHWMLNQLCLKEGDMVTMENVTLKQATFSKFQPQTVDFLDITDPKAVLESKLRLFACLTKGDIIGIEYNDKVYELLVVDTKPEKAVSIIECDMKVDFAAPVGYKEPQRPEPMEETDSKENAEKEELIKAALEQNSRKLKIFAGEGQRLDGKTKNVKAPEQPLLKVERGVPNYNYKRGKLTFTKAKLLKAKPEEPMETDKNSFTPFTGDGQRLKVPKKKPPQ
ncbi:hypothetical protein EMCRGX_G024131 [Ephydatia muelleri]|eukprot:Em0015g461a